MLGGFAHRLIQRGKSKWVGGTAAVVGAGVAASAAQAGVYYTPADLTVNSANPAQSVDFANDGSAPVDIEYSSTGGLTLNKQTAGTLPYAVQDPANGDVAALVAGVVIGSDSTFSNNLPATLDNPGAASPGEFSAAAGLRYIGIDFSPPEGTTSDYGWIAFQPTNDSSAASLSGTIEGYAYDNTGAPITTGETPEPTSLALLAMGAVGVGAYRRRSDRA